ncbi:MAG: hypothetical protein MJZ90_10245 [Bacteroidales bacterium]|nr:hypothetical protein [Bacteroidales bacterium]
MNKYAKQIQFFKNSIEGLKAQLEKSEGEKKTAIENRIKEAEEVISELEALANNNDAEVAARKIAAIENRMLTVENTMLKANIAEPKIDIQKIVNSASFANDFFSVVKNSETAADFRANLLEMVEMKHGIKNDVAALKNLLPGYIVNEINDAFVGRRHRLLELVRWTNLPCYKSLFETDNDPAFPYTLAEAASESQKAAQTRAYTTITIRPKFIYKLAKIDRELEKAGSYNGDVLVKFIVAELLDRILFSVEKNILAGLNVDNENVFVSPAVLDFDSSTEIPDARSYLFNTDSAIAIMDNTMFVRLKRSAMSNYNTIITDDMLAGLMGVQEIVITNAASAASEGTDAVWFLNVNDYVMVGDARPDQYENFNLSYNKKEYLMEIFVGGGCVNPLNFVRVNDSN